MLPGTEQDNLSRDGIIKSHEVCLYEDLFHRESALNLVGYCQLLEGKIDMAFNTFKKSLEIQLDNNCAIWHIGVMVSKLLRGDIHEIMKKDTDDVVILSTL